VANVIRRLALGAAALGAAAVMLAWLGSSRAEEEASRVGFMRAVEPGKLRGAIADARAARRLVPDVPAKVVEWRLLYVAGRAARAERLLDDMLREEPDNAGLWLLLLNTTRDRAKTRAARARLAELNPALLGRGG
jgi:predicted Zn-dependent protease